MINFLPRLVPSGFWSLLLPFGGQEKILVLEWLFLITFNAKIISDIVMVWFDVEFLLELLLLLVDVGSVDGEDMAFKMLSSGSSLKGHKKQ